MVETLLRKHIDKEKAFQHVCMELLSFSYIGS